MDRRPVAKERRYVLRDGSHNPEKAHGREKGQRVAEQQAQPAVDDFTALLTASCILGSVTFGTMLNGLSLSLGIRSASAYATFTSNSWLILRILLSRIALIVNGKMSALFALFSNLWLPVAITW